MRVGYRGARANPQVLDEGVVVFPFRREAGDRGAKQLTEKSKAAILDARVGEIAVPNLAA
jgi:hypothetical protein